MTAIQQAAALDAAHASAESDGTRIAVLTRGFAGGGVQKMSLHVARELAGRGWKVDLLSRQEGDRSGVPDSVRPLVLEGKSGLVGRREALRADPGGVRTLLRPVLGCLIAAEPLRYLPALSDYLREARPRALFSATTYLNLVALWARRRAGVSTRVLVSERDSLSENLQTGRGRRAWRWRYVSPLLARCYPWADAVVTVSDGVGDDLAHLTGLERSCFQTVYNPVVHADLEARCKEPTGDPWFADGAPPVILSVGRLVAKKQLGVLLRAVAQLRSQRAVRLLIVGEGPERARIVREAGRLGIGDDVRLIGWSDNPYAYMAEASVFAMTSNREGFGNVIVEALFCGCPIVSTDCPSGPAEILAGGRFGALVPVGDAGALARALAGALDEPPSPGVLRARGAEFTTARTTDAYLEAVGLPLWPEVAAPGVSA